MHKVIGRISQANLTLDDDRVVDLSQATIESFADLQALRRLIKQPGFGCRAIIRATPQIASLMRLCRLDKVSDLVEINFPSIGD